MRAEGFVKQITVGEVFQHKAVGVFPIVKNLTAENVLANPKGVLIAGLLQLIMALHQNVPICHFKGSMIEVSMACVNKKYRVMIYKLRTAIASSECPESLLFTIFIHDDFIRDHESEPALIPFKGLVKIIDHQHHVTQAFD